MVRTKKIFREDLLQGAYDFVLEEGFKKFRARRVADFINCSTQPIYHEFSDLNAYKQAAQTHITAEVSKALSLDRVTSLDELTEQVTLFAKRRPKEFYRFFLADDTCKNSIKTLLEDKHQHLSNGSDSSFFDQFEPFWFYSLGQAADISELS